MSVEGAKRDACREYVLSMLRELAILSLKCGEYVLAEQLMAIAHRAAEQLLMVEPSLDGAV